MFSRCTLSLWGNFSAETLMQLTAVRDVGLPLKSEADLWAVEKWIRSCSYKNYNIICASFSY